MTYEKQLSFKQVKVIKLLGKYHHVSEIIGMKTPLNYRYKVQAAFGERNGKIISGVYQSSTHNIAPCDECMLENKTADSIIVTVRKLAESFKLKAFDDKKMKGFLRHVLVRKGYATGQVMVVLVTATEGFKDEQRFINALLSRHPEITTVAQNVNPNRTSLVLGDKTRVLYGSGYIEDILCGCRFRISPRAFYQVNPSQTAILYGKALEFAKLTGKETVLDAYCGTGTIGIIAAAKAKEVIGIELNADAVSDARVNARLNGCENIRFYKGDAGEFFLQLAASKATPDVVVMDPPRAGASLDFLRATATLCPKKIVYISCNPETQARDISFLVRKGYKVRKIQPVDMFPHTEHIESVALLVRTDSSI